MGTDMDTDMGIDTTDAESIRSPAKNAGIDESSRGCRAGLQDGVGAAQTVTELSGTTEEIPVDLSADGCTIYFASSRPGGAGGYDLYSAQRGR